MGSCLSNQHNFDRTASFEGCYSPAQSAQKRRCATPVCQSDTGIFTMCSTPTGRSLSTPSTTASGKSTPSSTNRRLKLRNRRPPQNSAKRSGGRGLFSEIGKLSIVDDFGEMKLNVEDNVNESRGYFTKSITPSTSVDSHSELRYTRDTSFKIESDCDETRSERPNTPTGCSLEMEMFMLSTAKGIIGKTSSPMPQRREDQTLVLTETARPSVVRHSATYNKWCNFLESTPNYMMHNVTRIPEALAGHFCPQEFPAFIDVEIEGNIAKRFKLDEERDRNMAPAKPIISTEL